jgi:exodeoxyribonuclease III
MSSDPLVLNSNPPNPYLIISWNVNGYNSDIHSWLIVLIETNKPDIIFLSETKKKVEDLMKFFSAFTEYNVVVNTHNPSKWHGVAMLIRKDHLYEELPVTMNIPVRKDSYSKEAAIGRVIIIKLNKQINIIGSYTPNSGRSDIIKLDYRTKVWDPTFALLLEILRNNDHTIWIGDINVAPTDMDVSNPKTMKQYAGYTSQERENFASLLNTGNWIDVWRSQHPTERMYTWRGSSQKQNYGMRLDNIIVSKSLLPNILNSFMITDCPVSTDHIPIGTYIKSL